MSSTSTPDRQTKLDQRAGELTNEILEKGYKLLKGYAHPELISRPSLKASIRDILAESDSNARQVEVHSGSATRQKDDQITTLVQGFALRDLRNTVRQLGEVTVTFTVQGGRPPTGTFTATRTHTHRSLTAIDDEYVKRQLEDFFEQTFPAALSEDPSSDAGTTAHPSYTVLRDTVLAKLDAISAATVLKRRKIRNAAASLSTLSPTSLSALSHSARFTEAQFDENPEDGFERFTCNLEIFRGEDTIDLIKGFISAARSDLVYSANAPEWIVNICPPDNRHTAKGLYDRSVKR